MEKEKLLISSCMIGELVKYNGSHNALDKIVIEKLRDSYELYPFCPEAEGGLPIPRVPCEIVSKDPLQVINKKGVNKTKEFILGAQKALELCKEKNITKVLMKANSPSCSNDYIKDGTFLGKSIKGMGVTVELLRKHKIKVYNETQLKKLIY